MHIDAGDCAHEQLPLAKPNLLKDNNEQHLIIMRRKVVRSVIKFDQACKKSA